MKSISLIIGVCIIIVLLGAVLGAITTFRSAEYIQPASVSTGPGVTTATVVLVQPLFDDSTGYVTVTSNNTGDAAIPYAYVTATQTLTVSGLVESATHYLYVTFRYNQLDSYIAADIVSKLWPVMIGVGILGIIGAAIYGAYNKRED
jgi:flagellar basal body-associated protein FliL